MTDRPLLTPTQERVVAVIATGASDTEAARALLVTVNTLRTHVKIVMQRLDIHTRSGLTAWWLHRHYAAVASAARQVTDMPHEAGLPELARRVHALRVTLDAP